MCKEPKYDLIHLCHCVIIREILIDIKNNLKFLQIMKEKTIKKIR